MYTIKKQFEFSASHQLAHLRNPAWPEDDTRQHQCSRDHGHKGILTRTYVRVIIDSCHYQAIHKSGPHNCKPSDRHVKANGGSAPVNGVASLSRAASARPAAAMSAGFAPTVESPSKMPSTGGAGGAPDPQRIGATHRMPSLQPCTPVYVAMQIPPSGPTFVKPYLRRLQKTTPARPTANSGKHISHESAQLSFPSLKTWLRRCSQAFSASTRLATTLSTSPTQIDSWWSKYKAAGIIAALSVAPKGRRIRNSTQVARTTAQSTPI
jgi:hypothetical protein